MKQYVHRHTTRAGAKWHCKTCGHYFDYVRLPKAKSGSGVIAGRITVGRGFKWGAGLV